MQQYVLYGKDNDTVQNTTITLQSVEVSADLASMNFIGQTNNDYISLFSPCIDIPVGFNNLLNRITSINNRFDFTYLDEIFEEYQIFRISRRPPPTVFLLLVIEVQRKRKLIPGANPPLIVCPSTSRR